MLLIIILLSSEQGDPTSRSFGFETGFPVSKYHEFENGNRTPTMGVGDVTWELVSIIKAPGSDMLGQNIKLFGDMLISTGNEILRIQCAFIDTPEVEKITSFIEDQKVYPKRYDLPEYSQENESNSPKGLLKEKDIISHWNMGYAEDKNDKLFSRSLVHGAPLF